MRFYLNFPLVAGYVLMAVSACLGMLQFAAARGGYAGLALFSAERERGARIGAGLMVGALLAYVSFAPEILTPGPAGSEVAQMFALCTLFALGVTLAGAAYRIERERRSEIYPEQGEALMLGELPATLYRRTHPRPGDAPVVVLLPDPAGFVLAPGALIKALRRAGLAVLALDAQGVARGEAPLSRRALLIHLSTALVELGRHKGIDQERVGLLGLGLGGDAVWQAAASSRALAALAVSPVSRTSSEPEVAGPGLHWLREMHYFQAWRWRRRWSTLRRAAADVEATQLAREGLATAVLHARDDILAIRMKSQGIVELTTPGWRHFTLLAEAQARQVVAGWFKDKLGLG
jgi:dienelactone hydrolase